MKTYMQKSAEVVRQWHVIDAQGKVLGDIAVQAAHLLMGRQKPTYTPHIDGGDYVVIINASQVAVTGTKAAKKIYYKHSGIPGGFREEPFADLLDRKPSEVFERAVKGMLPKNKLQEPRLRRLKVFAGAEHTYSDKIKTEKSE